MWTLHSVKLTHATTPVVFKCLRQHNLTIDAQEEANVTGGSLYARFVSVLRQTGMIQLTSYDIGTVLNLCGLVGLPIGTGNPYLTAEFYMANYDDFGLVKSGANHAKLVVNKGLLAWKQVQCQTNQDATITMDATALDDGTNLPVVVTSSVALPTAPGDDARFSLGSCVLESITIGCLQSVNITGGQQIEPLNCGSDVYPKSLRVSPIKPTLDISTQDFAAFSSSKIPYSGISITNANTAVYLRKRLNNQAGFVPIGTAEHIKFALQGLARVASHQATAGDPGDTSIKVTTIDDGTNAPLVPSINVTHP